MGRVVRRRLPGRPRGDDGQIMLLALAYVLLAILLVTVVVCASAVHLARKELLALADLAALEAADAMDPADYYVSADRGMAVTDDDVRSAVEEYLSTAPESGRFTALTLDDATAVDAHTASVTLSAVADVPLLTFLTAAWSDGVVLAVTAEARAD